MSPSDGRNDGAIGVAIGNNKSDSLALCTTALTIVRTMLLEQRAFQEQMLRDQREHHKQTEEAHHQLQRDHLELLVSNIYQQVCLWVI